MAPQRLASDAPRQRRDNVATDLHTSPMRIRRRNPCFIEVDDLLMPDFPALLRGEARLDSTVRINLLCPISGDRIALTETQAGFIATLSAQRWHEVSPLACAAGLSEDEILGLAAAAH